MVKNFKVSIHFLHSNVV